MVIKQEHGLNYRTVDTQDEFMEWSPVIRRMVTAYKDKAGDKYEVDEIMNIMQMVVGSGTFFLFLVEDGMRGHGMLSAHASVHDDNTQGAMVHIGYVEIGTPKNVSDDMVKAAMDTFFAWAKDRKLKTVGLQSQRNDKSFNKFIIRYGWKKLTTVYTREIDHGRREENSTGDKSNLSADKRELVRAEANTATGV